MQPVSGATSGTWHQSSSGLMAVLKPRDRFPNRQEPFREWIASRLARLIGVKVPIIELYEHPQGPGALVYQPSPKAFPYTDKVATTPEAKAAFGVYIGIIVLDALIGASDRSENNLVFHEASQSWYSIDYSFCFGVGNAGSGVAADPSHPYRPSPNYPPEVKSALDYAGPIERALSRAERLTDTEIEVLCSEPPPLFFQGDRTPITEYLKFRKNIIRALVNDWLSETMQKPPLRPCDPPRDP